MMTEMSMGKRAASERPGAVREFCRKQSEDEETNRGQDAAGEGTLRREPGKHDEDRKKSEAIARDADDVGCACHKKPVQRHPDGIGRAQLDPAPDRREE